MIDLTKIKRIIDIEYHDILASSGTDIYHDKIRAYILDGSVVDIWFSKKIPGRFSYHWERRHINGKLVRFAHNWNVGIMEWWNNGFSGKQPIFKFLFIQFLPI